MRMTRGPGKRTQVPGRGQEGAETEAKRKLCYHYVLMDTPGRKRREKEKGTAARSSSGSVSH